MNFFTHFLFALTIGVILSKLGIISWELAIVCAISGTIVDIDHYIIHIIKNKDNKFSILSMWNNSTKHRRFNQKSFIHYWKGALVLTIILSTIIYFYWQIGLALLIGYYSHLYLDIFDMKKLQVIKFKINKIYFGIAKAEVILNPLFILVIVIVWLI